MNRYQRNFGSGSSSSSSPEVDAVGNLPEVKPMDENNENRPPTPFPPNPTDQAIQIEPQEDQAINIEPPVEELSELPLVMSVRSMSSSSRHRPAVAELPHAISAPSTSALPRRAHQPFSEEIQQAMPSTSSSPRRTYETYASVASTSSSARQMHETSASAPSTSSSARRMYDRHEPIPSPSSSLHDPLMGRQSPSTGSEISSFDLNPPPPLSPNVCVLYSFPPFSPSPSIPSRLGESDAVRALIDAIRSNRRVYELEGVRTINAGLYMAANFVIPNLPAYDEPCEFVGSGDDEEQMARRDARLLRHARNRATMQNRTSLAVAVKSLSLSLAFIFALYYFLTWIESPLKKKDGE